MELTAVTEDFNRKFSAPALHLLNESEELFIGQFFKFDNGEMIVKFRASRAFPRKGEYVQAMYLPKRIYIKTGSKALRPYAYGSPNLQRRVLCY